MLARLGGGFGGLALSALVGGDLRADVAPEAARYDLAPKPSHFPGKAKSVIQLFMHGGPSHVDLFDPKPMLAKYDGQTFTPNFAFTKYEGTTCYFFFIKDAFKSTTF